MTRQPSFRSGGAWPLLLAAALASAANPATARPADDPATAGLAALRDEDARVARVAHRLFVVNRALCPQQGALAGVVIHDLGQYAPATRPAAQALFGLGGAPAIAAVVPGSGAERAGIAADDAIVAIDGQAVADVPAGRRASYDGVAAATARLDAALARGPATLTLRRARADRQVRLVPDPGCAARVQLVAKSSLDASKGGTLISVNAGLAALAEEDDALAFVIAHELGHIILNDRARLDAAGVSRGMFAGLGRNGAKLREAEHEVDALALWLMARAGYDPDVALRFADAIGRRTRTPLSDGTHPRWGKRAEAMRPVIAAIAVRRAAGGELLP